VEQCGEATRQRKNLNGGSCATNLTNFGQIGFKQNLSLHQTKLETDSQNGFTSSRCIFLM
jgi:hypothetical protein